MARFFSLLIVLLVLSGCGSTVSNNGPEVIPELIDVQFKTNPEIVKANEVIELIATVSQRNEKVDDADKVEFEIWKEGQEESQHEKIEANYQQDGLYVISYIFEEPGKYFIYSHTTARSYHSMPKNEILVK